MVPEIIRLSRAFCQVLRTRHRPEPEYPSTQVAQVYVLAMFGAADHPPGCGSAQIRICYCGSSARAVNMRVGEPGLVIRATTTVERALRKSLLGPIAMAFLYCQGPV